MESIESLRGEVEDIIYRNDDTGFAVVTVNAAGEEETVVGELADVNVGEILELYGEYASHPTFGRQFKVKTATRVFPSDEAGIIKYLSGGVLPGIGVKMAERIVAAFGEETLDVLASDADRIAEIKGISSVKAREIQRSFEKIYGIKNMITMLTSVGLTSFEAMTLCKLYGTNSYDILVADPYFVCGSPLYKSFDDADVIASQLGIDGADECRIRAGLVYILRHNLTNGHSCVPVESLLDVASAYLDIDRDSVEINFYNSAELGFLAEYELSGEKFAFLPEMLADETYIAERLLSLIKENFISVVDAENEIEDIERRSGTTYSDLQREAIRSALHNGVSIITGGPGTGKTTALRAILELCEKSGEKVFLCAPTGRASKRLAQVAEHEASTIHRLLEVAYDEKNEKQRFIHNENNPLKCDTVIVDEMSMVDIQLFASLLRGLKRRCRVVLVGDPDQLPAIGAGNVLDDMISSGKIPTVQLTEVFRQAAMSNIVMSAHEIVNGQIPEISNDDGDMYYQEARDQKAARLICDLACTRIPIAFDYDPFSNIQILSPGRAGLCGVENLNEQLRERLNPAGPGKPEIRSFGRIFRLGDKVMQTRNDYDLPWKSDDGEEAQGVYNGDIGRITGIDREAQLVTVRFDDRVAQYTVEGIKELELAYAVTVHKSQGSEFDCVILSVADVPKKLQYRNLLYTAVTRAKELLVIVGQNSIMTAMIENDRKSKRYTALKQMLLQ